MITWLKNVNKFEIRKVQHQFVAYHLLDFFANFSQALLIKVLLIKKIACIFHLIRVKSIHRAIFIKRF